MFSFFSRKERLSATGLLNGLVDIHAHLLPGVDDGVATMEESVRTLSALAGMGIRRMYLTSHVMDTTDAGYKAYYREQFEALKAVCPEGVEIRLAAEYMLDMGFAARREEGLLAMSGGHVLVETSYMAPPPDFIELLYEVVLDGYHPIVAHPERYMYMGDRDYRELKEKGCRLQLNILSLSGLYGRRAEEVARRLLKEGYYDHVGTDIHQLEKFQKALETITLHKTERQELERLVRNNDGLW
ncbi:protein-tyrosine phosphatase [Parabacteroides sp. PFB2-12]|uniref:tyrosine-protein phosphatase n=1 Tax=unclassified Parabacteroides TaxID=2649774 RepID=UPI002472F6A6|nr:MULTISPECIES: CpsB/CapC family capsule biosynthesis tyrosine phosphatase [unclassified Parabacteroides]MDH6342263.1 protein-tyrosine phosphatase [Parabacteroides sp. PM6-13]MDH6390606.1 protein-tyrosine phosphatase [Parabacteroides sp. PFB2-12]